MTMTLDLQISFNVTAFQDFPLIIGTMWMNYEPDLSKGSENGFFSYNSAMILTLDLVICPR